jgi:Secretion system C-terminal sorting domain
MKLALTLILLTVNTLLFSQPNLSWIKKIDTSSCLRGVGCLIESNDLNGYIFCGYVDTVLYIYKMNNSGNVIKVYNTLLKVYPEQIIKTGDGYTLIGGIADSFKTVKEYIMKINEDLEIVWTKKFPFAGSSSVCLTPDSGIVRMTNEKLCDIYKTSISRSDSKGNILWHYYYGNDNVQVSQGEDIICTQDSGFAITGFEDPANLWFLKIDKNGITQIDTAYNLNCLTHGFTIRQTFDGGYVISSYEWNNLLFLKLTSSGAVADSFCAPHQFFSQLQRIYQTADSGYIGMYTDIPSNKISQTSWLRFFKLDKDFNLIWTKIIPGNNYYIGFDFVPTNDNSVVASVWSSKAGVSYTNDILLLKLEGGNIPREVISFSCHTSKKKVYLNWETVADTNNYGFDIEKSYDKNNWEKIGFVKGNLTSTALHKYTFSDPTELLEVMHYRLKQIDLDGTFSYSNYIKVESDRTVYTLLQNYPDPFNPVTTITYLIPDNGRVNLAVYNILGQKVETLVDEVKSSGSYSIEFDGSNFPDGIYFYQLTSGTNTLRKKMLLLKWDFILKTKQQLLQQQ